jgi:hypothetical protein
MGICHTVRFAAILGLFSALVAPTPTLQAQSISAEEAQALAEGRDATTKEGRCGNNDRMHARIVELLNSDIDDFVESHYQKYQEFACKAQSSEQNIAISPSSAGNRFNNIKEFPGANVSIDAEKSSLKKNDKEHEYCDMQFYYHSDWDSRHAGSRTAHRNIDVNQNNQQPMYDYTLMVQAILDPESDGFNEDVDLIYHCEIQVKNYSGGSINNNGTNVLNPNRQNLPQMAAPPTNIVDAARNQAVHSLLTGGAQSGPINRTECAMVNAYGIGEKCDPNARPKTIVQEIQAAPGEAVHKGQEAASGLIQSFFNGIFGGN